MLGYHRQGTGEPIVLIHGLLGSQEIWERVVPRLASSFEVITIDLPGHGGTSVPAGVHTMRDIVDELVALLHHLKLSEVTLVGHSWGGYLTAEAIERIPDRISRAALVYSQPYADPPEKQQARTDAIARFEHEPWDDVVRSLFPVYFADYDPPEFFERALQISRRANVDGARLALSTVRDRADRTEAILAHPEIPVLFISGEDDAAMPDIDLQADHVQHVVTKSGHMGPLTVPDEFVRILREWIAETGGNEASPPDAAPEADAAVDEAEEVAAKARVSEPPTVQDQAEAAAPGASVTEAATSASASESSEAPDAPSAPEPASASEPIADDGRGHA